MQMDTVVCGMQDGYDDGMHSVSVDGDLFDVKLCDAFNFPEWKSADSHIDLDTWNDTDGPRRKILDTEGVYEVRAEEDTISMLCDKRVDINEVLTSAGIHSEEKELVEEPVGAA